MNDLDLLLPPRQSRSRKTVERALDGSIEVIAEAGWAGFTMPAVSRKAGVSVPLLHRRFGGKEDLFLAAQGSVLQQIEAQASAAFAGSGADALSASETIDRATGAVARIFFDHAQLLRGFNERGATDSRVRDRAQDTLRLEYRLYSERLLRFAADIRLEEPEVGVGLCFATLAATLNHEAKHNDARSHRKEWDRLVDELALASRAYLLGDPVPVRVPSDDRLPLPAREPAGDNPRDQLIAAGIELLGQRNYEGLTAVGVELARPA